MSHKPSRRRVVKGAPAGSSKKPQGRVRATRNPARTTGSNNGKANPTGMHARAVLAREALLQRRERALAAREAALHERELSAQPVAEIEQLMAQLREANERLIVAVVHAEFMSDEARTEAAEARSEVERLLDRLRDANAQLVVASAQARALEEQARQREEAYRRLSSRLLYVQDEERRRLAVDLHDSTAQLLTALIVNLDLLQQGIGDLDKPTPQLLADSRSLADQCAREIRTFAYLLHPPLLDQLGLQPAVRWYVEGFTNRSGVQVDLHLDEFERLPGPTELALFRVIQESLTNVHRHAASRTASIRLTSTSTAVTLEVQDRGRGLRDDLKDAAVRSEMLGVGIQGMRERIRQLGGTVEVTFTDRGTTVRVRVPINGVPE
jgi:signal transduction histidine kinase